MKIVSGKKWSDIFSIGMCVLLFAAVYWFYSYNKKRMWFDEQALGVNLQEFKAKWGEPQKQLVLGGDLMVFYDCDNILGHRYVFRFDSEKHNLTFKYYDD